MTFLNSAPTVRDTITITATVKNTGLSQAENVVVQFYDGDQNANGSLIGESTLAAIPAFSSTPASIT
ncbi:MAG: CARDB domain-containing protein [Nitrospirota bacterium]